MFVKNAQWVVTENTITIATLETWIKVAGSVSFKSLGRSFGANGRAQEFIIISFFAFDGPRQTISRNTAALFFGNARSSFSRTTNFAGVAKSITNITNKR
jgi:hypothetical protein